MISVSVNEDIDREGSHALCLRVVIKVSLLWSPLWPRIHVMYVLVSYRKFLQSPSVSFLTLSVRSQQINPSPSPSFFLSPTLANTGLAFRGWRAPQRAPTGLLTDTQCYKNISDKDVEKMAHQCAHTSCPELINVMNLFLKCCWFERFIEPEICFLSIHDQ